MLMNTRVCFRNFKYCIIQRLTPITFLLLNYSFLFKLLLYHWTYREETDDQSANYRGCFLLHLAMDACRNICENGGNAMIKFGSK